MKTIQDKISIADLTQMSEKMFDNLVKAVVDVEQEIMVVDAGLHSDEELFMLGNGSKQGDLWGINIYPDKAGTENFIEFDSMINMRPGWGNRTRGVDDIKTQEKIKKIVTRLVKL